MAETTDFDSALVTLEEHPPASCPTEGDWYDVWKAEDVNAHDPLAIALVGGALADRLAWVFHAGYQGMMRYAFPFCPKGGWASYLVAEDKTGEYPGTSVTTSQGRTTVTGFKSWVAASRHVDHLVVRVAKPSGDVLVVVERDESGVKLSSRDKPGFLPDLSQGFAAFDNVTVSDGRIFTEDALPANFGLSEPLHVLTALNAFMVSHALSAGGGDLPDARKSLSRAADLVDRNVSGDDFVLGVADLDAETTATAGLFEAAIEHTDEALFERWQQDRGLVRMFSRGLQKRAARLRGQ